MVEVEKYLTVENTSVCVWLGGGGGGGGGGEGVVNKDTVDELHDLQ